MGALPTPPELVGGTAPHVPWRPSGLVSACCSHAETAFSRIKLSRQEGSPGLHAGKDVGNATASEESSVTESAVTADTASPPLGLYPHRQRWHIARTVTAAVLVE